NPRLLPVGPVVTTGEAPAPESDRVDILMASFTRRGRANADTAFWRDLTLCCLARAQHLAVALYPGARTGSSSGATMRSCSHRQASCRAARCPPSRFWFYLNSHPLPSPEHPPGAITVKRMDTL